MVESTLLLISKSELQELIKNEIISTMEKYMSAPSIPEDVIFTRQEAAKYLKISTVTLWSWSKKNIIPSSTKGKIVRYRKSDIDKALKSISNIKSCKYR